MKGRGKGDWLLVEGAFILAPVLPACAVDAAYGLVCQQSVVIS